MSVLSNIDTYVIGNISNRMSWLCTNEHRCQLGALIMYVSSAALMWLAMTFGNRSSSNMATLLVPSGYDCMVIED